jgi:hypothetical protein
MHGLSGELREWDLKQCRGLNVEDQQKGLISVSPPENAGRPLPSPANQAVHIKGAENMIDKIRS